MTAYVVCLHCLTGAITWCLPYVLRGTRLLAILFLSFHHHHVALPSHTGSLFANRLLNVLGHVMVALPALKYISLRREIFIQSFVSATQKEL